MPEGASRQKGHLGVTTVISHSCCVSWARRVIYGHVTRACDLDVNGPLSHCASVPLVIWSPPTAAP